MRFVLLFMTFLPLAGCQPASLFGEVLDMKQQPIRGASVQLQRNGQTVLETSTDSGGVFVLTPVGVDDSIRITAPAYQTAVEVYDLLLMRHPQLVFHLKPVE